MLFCTIFLLPGYLAMDALWRRLYVCPGSMMAANGVCLLYNGTPRPDGYIHVSYRHPVTGTVSSSSVHRIAVVLSTGTLDLPRHLDASHLCHNKTCILVGHVSLEPRAINCQRRRCVSEGQCLGHAPFPNCLLHLRL